MNFGALQRFESDKNNQRITLYYEKKTAKLEWISSNIVRFFAEMETEEQPSFAIEEKVSEPTTWTEQFEGGILTVCSDELCVEIGENFTVNIYDTEGKPLCREYTEGRGEAVTVSAEMVKKAAEEGHWLPPAEPPHRIEITKCMEGGDFFYGLGDKTGYMNKRGYDYVMWNTDNPRPQLETGEFRQMYKTFPFMLVIHDNGMYGLFFDNHCKSWFNIGKESEDYYWFGADHGNLDYYFIGGKTPAEILKNYTKLTGTTPLPQKWTLGYHQSRWAYASEREVMELANTFREKDIPCDVIHLDIDYMEEFAVFTWNEKRFARPKEMIDKLREMGFKIVTIIDPGVKAKDGYFVYEEGLANNYFVKTPEGEVYHNEVWPGDSVFPDFSNPKVRAWWGELQTNLIDKGVRGVWNDMNEPASFKGPLPNNLLFDNDGRGAKHRHMHNVYGHLMSKATYKGWEKLDQRRPFVITRACYSGSQKYALGWTGDNVSIWTHLQMAIPQMCNIGISGMAMIGTDIGGFGDDTTPELFSRWIQMACFTPFFRNHTTIGSRYQEPWKLGKETEEISRKYIKFRYHILPYIYDVYRQTEQTGMPVMRSLVLEYPNDSVCRSINDEFMLGDCMLVAPVVQQGQRVRMVYLPEGQWIDYWTGEQITGGTYFVRQAPMDVCPLYVKAGIILPTSPDVSYSDEKRDKELILEVWEGDGSYIHYQDNEEDFAYRHGAYNEYRIEKKGDKVTVTLAHHGYEQVYETIQVCYMESGKKETVSIQ